MVASKQEPLEDVEDQRQPEEVVRGHDEVVHEAHLPVPLLGLLQVVHRLVGDVSSQAVDVRPEVVGPVELGDITREHGLIVRGQSAKMLHRSV